MNETQWTQQAISKLLIQNFHNFLNTSNCFWWQIENNFVVFTIHNFVYMQHNTFENNIWWRVKSKKNYEDSLDWIPSPSLKIQLMGGKGVKSKHCWMLSTNFCIHCFCLYASSNLPRPKFEFSLKVMRLNTCYLLKSSLLYH